MYLWALTLKLGAYSVSVHLSVITFLNGLERVTGGHRNFVLGSIKRSWCVYMPFGSFGPIRHRKLSEFYQNVKKKLVWARTVERMVIVYRDLVIGSEERFWCVDVSFRPNTPPEVGRMWPKFPQMMICQNMSIYK